MEKEWKCLLAILAIAFFLRALPLSFEYFSDPDSFFHARSVELFISGQSVPAFDPISQQGRAYPNAPVFHLVYASYGILSGLGTDLMLKLLSIIFALATILVIYAIAARMFGRKVGVLSALALSITLLHIFRTAGFPRPDALGLMLFALGVFAFMGRRGALCGIAAIALALVSPMPTGIAFVLALLSFWGISVVKGQERGTKIVFCTAALFVLVYGAWMLNYALQFGVQIQNFYSAMAYESSEMQSTTAMWYLSTLLFAWVFALFAFVKIKGGFLLKAWAAAMFLFGIFATRFTIFLALPLAILAGWGLKFFEGKTKKYAFAFYGLVVLLALVTAIPALFLIAPYVSQPEGRAMEWISAHTPEDSNIGSDWDQGDAIGMLGQRKVVVDGHFEFNPSVKERNDSVKVIAASSDCAKISAEAKKWGINYYYVSQRDRESLTYRNGLLEAKCDFISKEYENLDSMVLGFGAR